MAGSVTMGDDGAPVLPQTLTLDHVSPATRLLEKRRQMFEVQEALDAQKEEFARREEAFRRREEGLRKKDLDLQESLIRFNKFLQENESKRTRAEKRANDERKFREEKDVAVQRLLRQQEKEKAETKKKKEELAKNRKYQLYLEQVQETHADDYPEISNILDRYKTLKDADESLDSRQRETERKMEVQRVRASQFNKAKVNEILNSNNKIAELKKELEQTEAAVAFHQQEIDKARLSLREQTRELGEVLFAVENLKNRCTSASNKDGKGPTIKHGRSDDADGGGFTAPGGEGDAMSSRIAAWMEGGGRETMEDLDIVAAYINDFQDIKKWARADGRKAYADTADLRTTTAAAGAGGSGAGAGSGAGRGGHGPGSPSVSAHGSVRDSGTNHSTR